MKQSILALILAAISFSCSSTLRTGYYKIEAVRGHTVNFKGVSGDWRVPTDTLKVGDTIFIQRVRRESQANVW